MEAHLSGVVDLSIEERPDLGTAGGVAHAARWLAGDDVVVVNADTWWAGDLAEACASWDRERVRVVVAGEGVLGARSRIVASLLPAADVARLSVEPSGLYEVCWSPAADAGRLDVVGWDGPVVDCATPRDYLTANLMASGGHSVVGEGAVVEGSVTRSVVWPGARVWPAEVLVDAIRTDGQVSVLVR